MRKFLKNKWVKRIGIFIAFLIVLFFGFYASIFFGFWGKIASSKELANLKQAQATQILADDEQLIGKIYTYDRQSVDFEDIPQHLINALVATEDARFYEHDGIDNKSLLRVFFKTILLSDKSSGGGSTITLQLAKNLYGRKDYGFLSIVINKLKESIVAERIEEIYSKNEIIALYFNTVPFSDNTYGIESAAHKFFNTSTKNLTLSQAATLVGSLKANHSYNPRLFPERSQLRRDVVLQQMVKYDYLSAAKAEKTMQQKIKLDYHYYTANLGLAPYFRNRVKQQVKAILEEENIKKLDGEAYNLYTDGLKIYTTLNAEMQAYAEEAMREHMQNLQEQYEKAYAANAPWKNKALLKEAIKKLQLYKNLEKKGFSEKEIQDSLQKTKETELFGWEKNTVKNVSTVDSLAHYLKFLNTGMLSVEPSTGAIKTYIGGIDYRYFQYDHVWQSKRQVGSTFKPFVYTAAIENGMDVCTHFPIKAVTYTDVDNWTPTNASNKYDEDLNYSLEFALSRSINTIAVKVLNETGIENVISLVKKMGIEEEIKPVPSIALGSADIKLIEMAKAYSTYVNNGKASQPYFIKKIEDKNGNLLAEFVPETNQKQAFSDRTRQVMLEMLQTTVNEGTAKRLRTTYGLRNAIAGKTGTTQNNKDGWFVGITPKLVNVVWVGNDNHKIGFSSTGLGQGANSALPIFGRFMQKLNADKEFDAYTHANFEPVPKNIQEELDCEPTEKDGFFKRLFGKKEREEQQFEEEKEDKKGGIFSFLKGKKEK